MNKQIQELAKYHLLRIMYSLYGETIEGNYYAIKKHFGIE